MNAPLMAHCTVCGGPCYQPTGTSYWLHADDSDWQPDPHNAEPDAACTALSPESVLPCRLPLGHPGVHEAEVNDTVTAVWSEERHPTIYDRARPDPNQTRNQT